MNTIRLTSWNEYWERQGSNSYDLTLQSLIDLDGFDQVGVSYMSEEAWSHAVGVAVKQLDLQNGDNLLEIGCGSGAMLLPLSKMGIRVTGIDYSESLVEVALRALPGAKITVHEARDVPFQNGTFTKILSHSVFQYFPDLSYAAEALSEMVRVMGSSGKILVMNIPKLSRESQAKKLREEELAHLPHLYYTGSFFTDFAEQLSIGIRVFDLDIPNYGNSPYRFNVLMWR